MTTAHKPTCIAYAVTGDGDQAFWTRIGAAWTQHSGEGLNIDLTAIPLTGRIILLPPRERQHATAEQQQ